MMTIYFYGSNREIVAENVKKCYSMIKKYGFNAAMGKIKLVVWGLKRSDKIDME